MANLTTFNLRLATLLMCTLAADAAHADRPIDTDQLATRQDIATSAGHTIPAGAFGFVSVARPREANLLQLRGIAGRGQAVLRTDEPGVCLTLPIRFVAGDFGGNAITGHLAEPILLIIRNREAARALARGRDIISDEFLVSSQWLPDTDIVLQSGLEESFGFVINTGRNILGDIFGVRAEQLQCQDL